MVDFLPDEIIHNILARLPTKPLIRCRCVSQRWNRLITEPYFMKLRSRRIIILPLDENVLYIDANTPVHDTPNLILKRRYPLDNLRVKDIRPRVIGTVNGVVLLAYSQTLVVYNPFTGVSKKLPHLADCPFWPRECVSGFRYGRCECRYGYGYGFGYGETPNDLKIVRFRMRRNIYDFYSFKSSSWSTLQHNIKHIRFEHEVGTFCNGFLYWITYHENTLTALNVKDMVLSKMPLPFSRTYRSFVLGAMGGCLCFLNEISWARFKIWVMKEHDFKNPWFSKCSFTLPPDAILTNGFYRPLCILDSGRILIWNTKGIPMTYDTSNGSYKAINISLTNVDSYDIRNNVLEYVESLVSPSDICSSL